ncbi:AAA family ATPase [Nocardia uniformis]|uniref:AAA family ATPase n=1 Tax=Nocardia uniformis TaxID=53432 RepID=A0A849C1Y8_9NOCA|nr:BTAD domain-containing putative transcriptional regulator [Nocardia uniformis]NNH69857.1 AAA family ATPase [Nocardia uniformis]
MAVTGIGVLGSLHITIDGERVPPGAPMQCAVLGRLVAAGGRVVPTDRLIDDLWNGDPPTKAVAALQVYIHNLRRVFEPDRPRRAPARIIVSESHGYALNLEPAQVDSWQFEQLLRGHEAAMRDPARRPDPLEQCEVLDAALACWHGGAFESFPGMPWAAQEAARLTALRLTALELRAQASLEMSRPAEVVLGLRPIFEEHPGREECARLLALAQYRLGQSLDALTTVRRCREFLNVEFGVDPGPALNDLETSILTHSVGSDAPTAPIEIRVSDPAADSGYNRQRAAVLAAAEAAAIGRVRLVWLSGEAGAGKTTLATAVTAGLSGRSWTTVFGRCPEVEDAPPAWAWAEVLTELNEADPETSTAADAFTLARRVVRHCRAAAGPVAIVLEDMHGADTATLQVLRQVVNWLRDRPVLIIATVRGTEAGPSVRDTAAALALFTADRIELDGLDLIGTRRAAAAAGLVEPDDHTVELLRRRTGGNPLFVRELAKLFVSQGITDAVPDGVRDLLGRRIAQLPAAVLDLLEQMSVWGEDSDVRTLTAASELAPDTVIDLVATAEQARLLRTERTGRITFDHALVRETVYYGIPVLRRSRMHWAAFELLCAERCEPNGTAPRGRDLEVLAHHAALGATAENAGCAIEFVRAAARRCDERRMRADAVRRWRSVLVLHELCGHDGPAAARADRTAVLRARCALVTALAYDGQHPAARAVREQALDLAEELGGIELLAQAATCWPTPLIWSVRDWHTPDPRIREPLRSARMDPDLPVRTRIPVLVSTAFDFALTDPAAARAAADEAAALAAPLDDPELLCTAINAQAFVTFTGGGFLRAHHLKSMAAQLLRVAAAAEFTEFQALAHYLLFRATLADADLAAAAEHARCAGEYATDGQLRHLLDALEPFEFLLELLRGDPESAERMLENWRRDGVLGAGPPAVVDVTRDAQALHIGLLIALAWARGGDFTALTSALEERVALAPDLFAHGYALALLQSGEFEHAHRVLATAPPAGPPFRATFMVIQARIAVLLSDTATARELYDELLPNAGTVAGLESGAAYLGPMDAILGELAAAFGDIDRAAAHRAAAEELTQRLRRDVARIRADRSRSIPPGR